MPFHVTCPHVGQGLLEDTGPPAQTFPSSWNWREGQVMAGHWAASRELSWQYLDSLAVHDFLQGSAVDHVDFMASAEFP